MTSAAEATVKAEAPSAAWTNYWLPTLPRLFPPLLWSENARYLLSPCGGLFSQQATRSPRILHVFGDETFPLFLSRDGPDFPLSKLRWLCGLLGSTECLSDTVWLLRGHVRRPCSFHFHVLLEVGHLVGSHTTLKRPSGEETQAGHTERPCEGREMAGQPPGSVAVRAEVKDMWVRSYLGCCSLSRDHVEQK